MFKRKIQKYIDEKCLFTLKDKVLVALSGGADSVALLRVLLSLGYPCECAHCNFHLRGEESNEDERFVHRLCEELGVELHVIHFETAVYARTHHISIEMAARELRYQWFESLRQERGAAVIAVAHHRDDSVETILLNLIRGTGIYGLKGISPKNGCIVRPLLSVSRKDIVDYLDFLQQPFVTDSTNLQDEYLRNKIRLNLLPLMQTLNPSVLESISDTGERLSEVAAIYQLERKEAVARKVEVISEDQWRISIASVLDDIAPMSLLHEVLSPLGFHAAQLKDIYRCLSVPQSGKRFTSSEWEVLRDRENLLIQRKPAELPLPQLEIEVVEITPSFVLPREKEVACLDADKVSLPLTIRKWQSGDRFMPLGMKGQKLVSDYLTDRKFSIFQKENQYVVCSGNRIVWLVNERPDHRFRITDDSRRAMILQIKG